MKKQYIWEIIIVLGVYFMMSSYQQTFNTFQWKCGEDSAIIIVITSLVIGGIEVLHYLENDKNT